MSDFQIKSKNKTQRSTSHSNSENQISRMRSQFSSRKTNFPPATIDCATWNFLQGRKQSQLNSMFNIRKKRLDTITKANYAIYQKINMQVSHYQSKFQNNNIQNINKFNTIDATSSMNPQNRRVLGPITNFRPLQLPISNTQSMEVTKSHVKVSALSRLTQNSRRSTKTQETQSGKLPFLFQFY